MLILSIILRHIVKIAINTRLLIKDKLDGIGWFTFETLKRMTQNHPEHQFYFLFDRNYTDEFIFADNITPVIIKPKARHPFLWYLWLEHSVRKTLKSIGADLFLSPDGYLSLKTNVDSIAVIHDINFFHRPKDLPFFTRHYYNFFFPKFAKKAKRIITVSHYSKNDIASSYHIDPEIIDVVYNGSNEIYEPVDEHEKQKVKDKFSEGKDFFIFIGSMHPRKNIANLFKAFDLFKKETNSDFKLIVVGTKYFLTDKIEKAFSNSEYKNDIIFTGRLNPETLHLVLASAYAMTFIPFFEGFGIPVIEAFNCDVPVICSDKTSLPEVAGNAGLYVDPYDIESVKNAMKNICKDPNLREHLIQNARIQRQLFSWDKTAEKLWNAIQTFTEYKTGG
jgi:glycosyltransferase involved in cell wall biosynthesis